MVKWNSIGIVILHNMVGKRIFHTVPMFQLKEIVLTSLKVSRDVGDSENDDLVKAISSRRLFYR